MTRTKPVVLVIALALVLGTVGPAVATTGATGSTAAPAGTGSGATSLVATDGSGNGSVNVTIGQQLSAILSTTSDDVRTEVENAAFEAEFEDGNESERAEALADRAEELRDRAEELRKEYANLTEAYESGDLPKSAFAARLATLNGRADNVLSSLADVRNRTANVSALDLRVAGLNRTALQQVNESLDAVTGAGPSALLARFTGESEGEVEIETRGGLSIEATSEDGERTREVERERARDDDNNFTVAQADALATARTVLSGDDGRWSLRESSVHADSGYYEFEFTLQSANLTGEAEVRVDGSTGEAYRIEEEVEPRDEERRERDDEADNREPGENESERGDENESDVDELNVGIAEGTPAPNATVTIRVSAASDPVVGATVSLDERTVGTTGANGTISVTLPADGAEITAESGEAEGELEFEFEQEDEVFRDLQTSASLDDGTVTVTVTYDGSGVANAKVYANGDLVGSTDSSGTVSFAIENGTEDVEIEVVKGEFEAEMEYAIRDGSLTQSERPHEGDGDKTESNEDENEREDEREDETDTPEPDEEADDEREQEEEEEDETEDEEETETPESDDDDEQEEEEEDEDEEDTDTPEPTETPEPDEDETDTPEPNEDDDETDTPEPTDTPEEDD